MADCLGTILGGSLGVIGGGTSSGMGGFARGGGIRGEVDMDEITVIDRGR